MTPAELVALLEAARVVPILRTPQGGSPVRVVDALAEADVRVIELTYTSPDPLGDVDAVRKRHPDVVIGMGTVTAPGQVDEALGAGADFIVTPVALPDVVAAAVAAGAPVIGAGLTPTEIFTVHAAGASAVKIFPAGRLGPGYLRDLGGPLPGIRLVPTGGIGLDEVPRYLEAGALAVGLGGQLIGDACAADADLAPLRARLAELSRVLGSR